MKDLIQEGRNLYQSFKHRMVENSGVISMDEPYIKDMDRFVKAIVSNFQKYAKRSKLQNVTVGVPIKGKYQIPFSDEELEYNVWIPITFDGKKYVFQFFVNQTDFRKYLSYVDREKSTKEVSDNGPVFKHVEIQNDDPSKEVFGFIQNRAEWEKGSGGAYKAHFESRHTRNTSTSLSEGKRRYKLGYNIGKSKYVISFHDGNSKHKDGSDFFDVKIFQNKNQFNSAIQDLEKQGYVEE